MAKRSSRVERPLRKSEFKVVFGTRQAAKGWQDLLAVQRGVVVDAWEFLTTRPCDRTADNYPLKDDLATVTRDGRTHEQGQHKLAGGARIWFYVEEMEVVLIRVSTNHPHETKT
ncbi:hypothetical protein GCM10025883_09560 [Mobilicoccus caccae]|uniref:Uncharacterized protein n=1 Tax=Mobilicoccus caccae TaxID=1859295 RepID=A0ABQ6IP91_9MICO|nr:hypothetical protein GCM10025883_09560 [Mobilicoccus caccae]